MTESPQDGLVQAAALPFDFACDTLLPCTFTPMGFPPQDRDAPLAGADRCATTFGWSRYLPQSLLSQSALK